MLPSGLYPIYAGPVTHGQGAPVLLALIAAVMLVVVGVLAGLVGTKPR